VTEKKKFKKTVTGLWQKFKKTENLPQIFTGLPANAL
jgi:hypothetical protein